MLWLGPLIARIEYEPPVVWDKEKGGGGGGQDTRCVHHME